MDEEVEMAAGADLNVFRDEARALGFQRFERGRDVFNVQRDVVQAFATLGEETADGRSNAVCLAWRDIGAGWRPSAPSATPRATSGSGG